VLRGYEYRRREGAFFLEPHDVVARLTSPGGQTIVLLARSLFHIEQTHIGPQATSRFSDRVSVGGLLGELTRRLPDEVSYRYREARLEFACEKEMGSDVVAGRSELVAAGCLSASDSTAIEPFRSAVVELNLFGDKSDKHAFIAEANAKLRETAAAFVLRRQSIVAQYSIPALPTSWFSLVVYQDRNGGDLASGVGEIRTIYPGRVREPFPAGRWFFPRYGADRASSGLQILKRLKAGLPLEKTYQRQAVQAQRRAQDFWWEHALLAASSQIKRLAIEGVEGLD
jgi:hypothetical protein